MHAHRHSDNAQLAESSQALLRCGNVPPPFTAADTVHNTVSAEKKFTPLEISIVECTYMSHAQLAHGMCLAIMLSQLNVTAC